MDSYLKHDIELSSHAQIRHSSQGELFSVNTVEQSYSDCQRENKPLCEEQAMQNFANLIVNHLSELRTEWDKDDSKLELLNRSQSAWELYKDSQFKLIDEVVDSFYSDDLHDKQQKKKDILKHRAEDLEALELAEFG